MLSQFFDLSFFKIQFLVLNERRQDMDFAKHELRNAKAPEVVEMKNLVYENAQKHFESQLQKVRKTLFEINSLSNFYFKIGCYAKSLFTRLPLQN